MEEQALKFVCDEQLGKLARWLRIIGQDTEYRREIDDPELISWARSEGRTILTRDRGLARKASDVRVICLVENYPALQLREVVELFKDEISIRVFSRCVACNGEIEEVAKPDVEGLVPPFVFETQTRFTRCIKCKKVFWQATHRERVDIALKDVLKDLYPKT